MEVGHAVSKRFDVQLSRAECLIRRLLRDLGHLCEVATTVRTLPSRSKTSLTQCLAKRNTLPLKYWLRR